MRDRFALTHDDAVCEFEKSPTEIYGALGVQCALTQAGEKGLESCASDPATCGDS